MGMDGKRTKLKNSNICKVDLVPKGAQQHSKIAICKSEPINLIDRIIKLKDSIIDIFKSDKDDKAILMKGAIDQFSSEIEDSDISVIPQDEERSDNTMAEFDKTTLSKEAQEHISALEAEVAILKVAKEATSPTQDDILKGLPEAVVKMINEQKTQNKALAEQVAKMADANVLKEYVAKAAKLGDLPIKADELALIMKSLATSDPTSYTKIETLLTSTNEMIAKSKLFDEEGTDNSQSIAANRDEAWTKIQVLANAMVAKDSAKSLAQAIDEVISTPEGRKLYSMYNVG